LFSIYLFIFNLSKKKKRKKARKKSEILYWVRIVPEDLQADIVFRFWVRVTTEP